MILKYSLNEFDYLEHQLYIASKSKKIKKQRLRSLLVVSISILIIAYFFYKDDPIFSIYFFGFFLIITIFFYPMYLGKYYKRHYKNYLLEHYKNRFNKTSTITFKESNFETSSFVGESKINYSVIEDIIEIPNHIFIKLQTGGSLIIPKSNIENPKNVKLELKKLAKKLNIKFVEELTWKWK